MQIRPHERKNMVTAGIFVSILLIVTAVSIFLLGKERSVFENKITLYTEVDNAQNLKSGAFVQFKGIKIGTVEKVEVASLTSIRISLSINANMQKWIHSDSYIMFKTEGVLGDKFLEILGGTEDSPIVKEGEILKVRQSPNIANFITKGEDIIVTASRVLVKIDKLLSRVDGDKIAITLDNINRSSLETKNILSSLNPKEIRATLKSVKMTSQSLSSISKQVQEGPGSLHSLIYDRAVHDDLQSLLGGANRSKVLKYFIRESIKKSEETK